MVKTEKSLFKENGEPAGFWDVCDWWMESYPEDVFVFTPEEVVEIRNQIKKLALRRLNGQKN